MQPARVTLHDGFGGVVASLTTASSINRAWQILQPASARITVAMDDPAIAACDPALGHVLVVESEQYPHPWVGGIVRAGEDHRQGEVTLQCLSLDAILRNRFLPVASEVYQGSVGSVFARLLGDVNGANGTGISISPNVTAEARYAGAFSDRSLYSALTALAQQTGHEWWVDYDVRPEGITASANIGPARGTVRVDVQLTAPGNSEILESAIDLQGAIFLQRVVAGQTSTLEAYSERSRVTRRRSSSIAINDAPVASRATVHGFELERADLGGSPLTRREAVLVAEQLQDVGAIAAAADVLSGRPPTAERVLQWWLTSHDTGLWRACSIGSVVRMKAAGAYLGRGLDAPVRIVSVQPMEEAGDLVIAGQVLREPGGE